MIETQSVDVSHILAVPGISKESGKVAPLIPSWVQEVRRALVDADRLPKQSVEATKSGDQPEDNLSVLLDQAEQSDLQAQVEWRKTIEPLIRQKLSEWSQKITDFLAENGSDEDLDPVDRSDIEQALQVIDDPDQFIKRIFIHQLGIVSCLAQVDPEIWQTALGLANEFQMTKMVLFRRETVRHKDTQTPEARLLIDLALILTKYVNAQQIKQVNIAQVVAQQEEVTSIKPDRLADIPETMKLAKRIHNLGLSYAIQNGENELTAYLGKLSDSARNENYTSELYDQIVAVAQKFGILIIPTYEESGVDGQKDAELRLGIVDDQSKQWQQIAAVVLTMAQKINDTNQDSLESLPALPDFFVAKQIIAAGSGMHWNTQAQILSDRLTVPLQVAHPDVIKKTVEVAQLPLMEKYVVLPDGFDKKQFLEVAMLVTLCHEAGHAVLPVSHVKNDLNENENKLTEAKGNLKDQDSQKAQYEDKKDVVNSLDELKAEAVGVKLFLQMLSQRADSGGGEEKSATAEQYCLALLGTLFDYMQKSSSGSQRRYYYTGQIIMHSLLESGSLVRENGKFRIADAQSMLQTVDRVADKVLGFYTNSEANLSQAVDFFTELMPAEPVAIQG